MPAYLDTGLNWVDVRDVADGHLADQVLEEGSQERFHCQTGLLPVRFTRRGRWLCTAGMVGSSEAKRRLGKHSGAIAVDRESAGVARAALLGRYPFVLSSPLQILRNRVFPLTLSVVGESIMGYLVGKL